MRVRRYSCMSFQFAGLIFFLVISANANSDLFEDFEKEIDEMNASGKGYQGLLDDLDAAGNESAQPTKVQQSSLGNHNGKGLGDLHSDSESDSDEFKEGDVKVVSPRPGIYAFTCKNDTRGTLNASSILQPGSASKAVSQFERYVKDSISSVCGGSGVSSSSSGAVNWVFGKVRAWVEDKHKTCLKKYPGNKKRCGGYEGRAPGFGVRG